MTSASGSPSDPAALGGDDVLASSDHLDQALGRFISESRVDDAATARRRRRDMRDAAEGDASLLGLFVDLAESQVVTTVSLVDGTSLIGTIDAVGADFIALLHRSLRILVPERSIAGFEPPAGTVVTGMGRTPPMQTRFRSLFPALAEERAPVRLHASGEITAGVVASAGTDVLVLESGGHRQRWFRIDIIDMLQLE